MSKNFSNSPLEVIGETVMSFLEVTFETGRVSGHEDIDLTEGWAKELAQIEELAATWPEYVLPPSNPLTWLCHDMPQSFFLYLSDHVHVCGKGSLKVGESMIDDFNKTQVIALRICATEKPLVAGWRLMNLYALSKPCVRIVNNRPVGSPDVAPVGQVETAGCFGFAAVPPDVRKVSDFPARRGIEFFGAAPQSPLELK